MKPANRIRHILVISQSPALAETTRKAAEESITVDYAASEAEGLNRLREIRPDIIVLGRLDPQAAVLALYRELRDGWISHHASTLIVEFNELENTFRILSDENLTMSIGDHAFWAGSASQFMPADKLVPRLTEAIAQKLKARENRFR